MIWRTDAVWIDVAVFLLLLLVGHILLGHFEAHRPKWRRVLKVILSIGLFIGMYALLGRLWTWIFFGSTVSIGLLVVHGWWLPKHGINGWTGEPRDKYLELVRGRKRANAR